jgi:hypothetical protein
MEQLNNSETTQEKEATKDVASTGQPEESNLDKNIPDETKESGNVERTESEQFIIERITKRDDGTLEFRADPSDPKSSVYIGKDINEVLENIAKGIVEKDNRIRMKIAEEKIKVPQRTEPETEDILLDLPDRESLIVEEFKKRGLDPKMVNWSDSDWDEYQIEHDLRDRHIIQLQAKRDEALKNAESRYISESVDYVNAQRINSATQNIREIAVSTDIDPDEYGKIYIDVLNKVYDNPKFKDETGILKDGVIEKEFFKAVIEKQRGKMSSAARTKIQEKIAQKKDIINISKVASPFTGENKPPSGYAEAIERAKRDIRSGKLK